MIKFLQLCNLVLVDTCSIEFHEGFNVLTGETGAGKTALTEAIGLLLGQRSESALIRKGEDKAFVEGAFDVESQLSIHKILEDAGIPCDPGEFLIVRREIAREGKSRCLINAQMAPLPILQKIAPHLINLVSQHSASTLRSSENQRALLDLFGNLKADLAMFQESFEKEKVLNENLSQLLQRDASREKELEITKAHLQEIQETDLKAGEEELLFEEYQRLSHVQELGENLQNINRGLSDSDDSLLSRLGRYKQLCENALKYDKSIQEPCSLIQDALIALREAAYQINAYLNGLENDPGRYAFLEQRLSTINQIKRKFGKSLEEIVEIQSTLQKKLDGLENLSEEISQLQAEVKKAANINNDLAQKLTLARTNIAKKWQVELTAALRELNMSSAELIIEISLAKRSAFGDDLINFKLMANKGEAPVLVKEHSSGGELARLLFSIKTTLADKNDTPTIIFDEIDANVGGKTAAIIGEKLTQLGKFRQVICITHFPQVASKSDHHFAVHKEEINGRTVTGIRKLNKKERDQELLRMLGGDKKLAKMQEMS